MALPAGTRLGPYTIDSVVGTGAMGEVYRARDLRLGREVALKVLRTALSGDPHRLRRFELEARAASALDHPNILLVFDVGQHDGVRYLASELLQGETLRERLGGSGLPQRKALEYAIQVAQGLAAAHDKGVVHRDLKPENLFVTRDGRAKILDFGLAKLLADESPDAETNSRADAQDSTAAGAVLGTAGYMAPEQVRGLAADARSDIFAFGSVLYEILSRRRAFHRATAAETMTAILREEPLPLEEIDPGIPVALSRVVKRCLEKRPDERFQSMRDVAFALEIFLPPSGTPAAGLVGRRAPTVWLLTAAAVLVAVVAAFLGWKLDRRSPREVGARRVVVPLPAAAPLTRVGHPFALSDDGRLLVYVRSISRAQSDLWLRPIGEAEARPLAGTEGALKPFFSPDAKWVGFYAGGKLMKIPTAGGAPATICRTASPMGASWASDGSIVFAPGPSASLFRVSAEGGQAEAVTVLDAGRGDIAHRMPQVLPGGQAVLFTVHAQDGDRIAVQRFAGGERRILVEGARAGHYDGRGHIVYARAGALYAVPFDASGLEVTGPSARIAENVVDPADGAAWFQVSASGSVAFVPQSTGMAARSLVLVDEDGAARPLRAGTRAFNFPRLSPDGKRVAFVTAEGRGTMFEGDLWTYDMKSGAFNRLTFGVAASHPVWSPDGRRLAYASALDSGQYALLLQPADGSRPAERVLERPGAIWPGSWAAGGGEMTFMAFGASGSGDIFLLRLPGDASPQPIADGAANEWAGYVSPSGRWLAYVSDESGRFEVYVRPLAGSETTRQISTEGGQEPVWSADGGELFFRSGDRMMAVAVGRSPKLFGEPARILFESRFAVGIPGVPNYDVGPDGRFLMIQLNPEEEQERRAIHLILDWADDLDRRLGAARGARE